MKQYPANVVSEVEALRTKDSEKEFLKFFKSRLSGRALMKVTPFQGFYADMYYEEPTQDPQICRSILIKFMDTAKETFSILEEELLEIMEEEQQEFNQQLGRWGSGYKLSYVYFMPFVNLGDQRDRFSKDHIIDEKIFGQMKEGHLSLQAYMSENHEILANLIRYQLAKEYHVIKKEADERMINKDFKKILFTIKDHAYQAIPLTEAQMKQISSVKYGSSLYIGPSGSGKTTTMLARALKLSQIYSKNRFLFVTFNRQLMTDLNKYVDMIGKKSDNLEIINFHSFILGISKRYALKIDRGSSKSFDEQFDFIFRKISQICTDYHLYKGIFIDEAENFKERHFVFLKSLLYKNKNFLMISSDKAKDVQGHMQELIGGWENMQFDDIWEFHKNYRATGHLTEFTNHFIERVMLHCEERGLVIPQDYYIRSHSQRIKGKRVRLIQSTDIEGKLNDIVKSIQELRSKQGVNYSDICVVFPFNKRRLKSGGTIYFQYLLREALKKAQIPFIVAHEEITSLTYKSGITISNIFSVSNLEFRAVIVCELEMLYTHSLPKHYGLTEAQSFIKSMNMVYTALTRATDLLYIITLMDMGSNLYHFLSGEDEINS